MQRFEGDSITTLCSRIIELEAKLAGKEELSNIEVVSEPIDADDIDSLELKEAQSLYKQTTKRPIPMRYKNDLEWLTKQIKAEVLEEVED